MLSALGQWKSSDEAADPVGQQQKQTAHQETWVFCFLLDQKPLVYGSWFILLSAETSYISYTKSRWVFAVPFIVQWSLQTALFL